MTTFHITRATLAPQTRNLGALLADSGECDAGHRLVWTLFPGENAQRDFVYREVERGKFLIVSRRPAVDAHHLWRLDSKPYRPEPISGERYSFILRANPSLDISRGERRSQRVDAIMHAKFQARQRGEPWNADRERSAALDWLFGKEASLGVRFDRGACDASGYVQVGLPPKKSAKDRRAIHLSVVDYNGVIEVIDGARFAEKLTQGIGRAKAFGCGLMLIRRL